ncbi:hypothetical protein G7Y89_g1912 [Cudoniella acicularis]|uniref:Uncharacterized protein n=1 Tax=Cudoniella acicularis TaxID=354080 RepID=A0A8H4W938_9HELO|nr:hypothetical protein G7Y89_g1912 [Cudoniella acicularis]
MNCWISLLIDRPVEGTKSKFHLAKIAEEDHTDAYAASGRVEGITQANFKTITYWKGNEWARQLRRVEDDQLHTCEMSITEQDGLRWRQVRRLARVPRESIHKIQSAEQEPLGERTLNRAQFEILHRFLHCLGVLFIFGINGVLHTVAWNAPLLKHGEQAVWRGSTVVMTLFGFLYSLKRYFALDICGISWASHISFKEFSFTVVTYFVIGVWVSARLFITVEFYANLAFAPPGVFEAPSWPKPGFFRHGS